jgi:signal transduction histidine kinase
LLDAEQVRFLRLRLTLSLPRLMRPRATMCRLLLLASFPATAFAAHAGSSLPTLTTASQIRQLTPEQAALGYPVRVRGIITCDVPSPDFFVQDKTAGIFVEGSRNPAFEHRLGDLVEVEGITGPGRFAPVIREQNLRVAGKGRLPAGELYPFAALSRGQMDSQWVKVRGIVRSVSIDRTSWRETALALRVASGGGEFNARVPVEQDQDFSSWVDSEVVIEGVCGSLFTAQRQLSGVLFYVPRLSFIKLEPLTREVPFTALLRFSPGDSSAHRVRVRGVVTFQQLGNALFLQSQEHGLRVLTQQQTPVEVGDLVDAIGFPAMGESAPVLTDAVFHRVDRATEPAPVALDLRLNWERFDGALVTADATLLDRRAQPGGLQLLLRTGENLFEATLPQADSADPLLSVPINSQVRIKGICLVRSGGLWSIPQSFRVILRSPADVIVLQKPSWWNLRHTFMALGITAGVLLIVLAWVVVLGRRLREQMAVIRQKLQHGAVLEERNRIARELHDTLEQELAGITMQLDLASDCFQQAPRVAQQALETARSMSRHSMIEARRSVWDLRCQLLEDGSLVSAIPRVVEPLVDRSASKIDVRIAGEPVRLSAASEMNLLRIAQEAVANAVKHGGAGHIQVDLEYGSEAVRLSVWDDGRGFDPAQASSAGHFGLLDMKERAQSLGSLLEVQSALDKGTRISVMVQLKDHQLADEAVKANSHSGRG